MLLHLLHPVIAARSCEDCQKWQYDDAERGTKQVVIRGGQKLPRRGPTPCRTSQKCPKGTPEEPAELTTRNWLAYRHYLECKASGQFPDDPIVRRNASIIREVEESVRRVREDMLRETLVAFMRACNA